MSKQFTSTQREDVIYKAICVNRAIQAPLPCPRSPRHGRAVLCPGTGWRSGSAQACRHPSCRPVYSHTQSTLWTVLERQEGLIQISLVVEVERCVFAITRVRLVDGEARQAGIGGCACVCHVHSCDQSKSCFRVTSRCVRRRPRRLCLHIRCQTC